ncbi:hypothetical protein TI39_contig282g00016 [Zymoseptoria brevis]|uniref:NAD(P)-binding protein n=1 Tax=Zymoseptoria brevis TaxID=1047168 RepID=A0A0F4GW84_9PEZI|nr:hypothetical protein TI39_contig282g00016 [Zymoseptoria brevis]
MVSLQAVRAANRRLHSRLPSPTALFVGGTSGIGRSTLLALARNTASPKAYIVGRSAANAAPVLSELRQLNPHGTYTFIETDVSLLRNVDAACATISQREKSLDLMFLTPGGYSLSGRTETDEGFNHLFALRYYTRMRFIHNLFPLLSHSHSASSRVISILGAGFKGTIDASNLDLKTGYNPLTCALHSVTMTSLAMEHLATASKNVSFLHAWPGLVHGTNLLHEFFPCSRRGGV